MKTVYLDNSATTQISEEALEKYIEVSKMHFGNPSSLHTLGFDAEKQLTAARASLLGALSARDGRIVFTGSGSEANNLAIIGRAYAKERYQKGAKIITSAGEHASVTEPMKRLLGMGFSFAEIPTKGGVIDMNALDQALDRSVILVSMMLVNNETGALYDLAAVSALMKKKAPEAILHADATQAFMKLPFSPRTIGADLITLSSHKVEGPKGVGALYISENVIKTRGLSPIIFGGGQEEGFRSGTENVPAIAAFGEACKVSRAAIGARIQKMNELRDYLIARLKEDGLSEISPTLPPKHAPHILNLTLPSIKSETMLHYLSSEGICVSSGSACSSNGAHRASPALIAYGKSAEEADCSIRVSFSHRNEKEDVDLLVEALHRGLEKLQRIGR